MDRSVGVDRGQCRPPQVIVVEAKGHQGELGPPAGVDPLDGGEAVVCVPSQVETMVEELPESPNSVEVKRHPNLETPDRTAQLRSESGDVTDPHVAVLVPEVGASPLMGVDQ